MSDSILYIGGYELPDKNAAAQRVVGIAKGLRELGYSVIFLNSIKSKKKIAIQKKCYFNFECYEYSREPQFDYLFSGKTTLSMIKKIKPSVIIAYNYPAMALEKIRKYCNANNIKCIADVTEWYQATGNNIIYKIIKNLDTAYRMRRVQKRMDGIIAISRYLFDFYKNDIKTVLIPPTVDIDDPKWNDNERKDDNTISFVYAGVPYSLKEKLDDIVKGIGTVEKDYKTRLDIVGITEEQFRNLYSWTGAIPKSVYFWGRVEHSKAIKIIKKSTWGIILRENNQVVRAGFPTKLVESISAGTPVIINHFSNVEDYLNETNCIFTSIDTISSSIADACTKRLNPDNTIFDYRKYLQELKNIIN